MTSHRAAPITRVVCAVADGGLFADGVPLAVAPDLLFAPVAAGVSVNAAP